MKLYKLFTICAACSLALLGACSDDDAKTPLPSIKGESADVSYTSITFAWDKVAGATQYGYELYETEEEVSESGVTHDTSVAFSNLSPATEYTLKVWAYAAVDSEQTTSEPLVLKATTLTAMPLGKPQLQVSLQGRYATVTWASIANADEYEYLLTCNGEEVEDGSTESCELSLPALDPGVYTLTVTAVSESDAYLDGESVKDISIVANEEWRVSGTYTSALLKASWTATMVAYSDDSYEIIDWYSTDGRNLNFFIDKADTTYPFKMSSSLYVYDEDTEAYAVPADRSGLATVYVYPNNTACNIVGDKSGGTVTITVKNRNSARGNVSKDTFVW